MWKKEDEDFPLCHSRNVNNPQGHYLVCAENIPNHPPSKKWYSNIWIINPNFSCSAINFFVGGYADWSISGCTVFIFMYVCNKHFYTILGQSKNAVWGKVC